MWERVTAGQSGAVVTRRDGVYRKESDDPAIDLVGEGERLLWLSGQGIPAAEVLECRPGLLVTRQVPGRPWAGPWPVASRPRIVDALAGLTRALHDLPVADCPFDQSLAVTIPEALSAEVDLDDLDAERRGRTRDDLVAELLATRPRDEDLAVCHGDLSEPNVLFDPDTCEVSGVIDTARLGVADRWVDLAIAVRSLNGEPGSQFGPWAAGRYLDRYGIEPDPDKTAFYLLLDEFV
ncbi:APH(3') family aminoglycoside O-phosphotransferase [Actinomadura sp. 3N407]|uniref:APH(3') family aminoglycoside O-phosphotransferase n=1 Tax=Actinomadura sp. 3N407 TaxID=3457423 RepID=UPI003FCD2A87